MRLKIFGLAGGVEKPRGYEAYLRKQRRNARLVSVGISLLGLIVIAAAVVLYLGSGN